MVDEKLKQIGLARKHIQEIVNHKYFNNKFLMIILNIEDEEMLFGEGAEAVAEKTEEVIDEIKELLKYDEINVTRKEVCIIERGSYHKLWEKVENLINKEKR